MRILAPNWEGIHPAYPARPPPFNESTLTKAPFWGGAVGVVSGGIALLLKRSPAVALKSAAWTTVLYGVPSVALEQYAGHLIARPYIESKGLQVPKQTIIDRPFNVDADNFILAGAFAGLGFALSIRKPWEIAGWKRWLGSMSMGAFAGSIFNTAYHYDQVSMAVQIQRQQAMQRLMHKEDVKAFIQNRAAKDASLESLETSRGQLGGTSLQDMLKTAHDAAVKDAHAMADKAQADHDIDEEDPQPHYSEMRDGERVFLPEPNYKWQPGNDGVQKLEDHIQTLKARRTRLANEASMLFHALAVKQSDYYDAAEGASDKDQRRVTAELLSHLHSHTYLDISRIDWCIADAQKSILQLKAMAKNEHWHPKKPTLQSTPKHVLSLLDDFDHENEMGRAEMDMLSEQANAALQDPGLAAMDITTGKVVDDPYAQIRKDLAELEKVQKESDMIRKAIVALRKELENEGNRD